MKKGSVAPQKNAGKAAPESVAPVTTSLECSEAGEIKIHENVISSLARRAVLGVEGVSRLSGSILVDNIAEIVGSRRMQDRSVTIEIQEDNRVAIELKVNILIGYRLPEVAEKVQKAVIDSVEAATGMTVTRVNVLIQELEEPRAEEEEEEPAEEEEVGEVTPLP